MTALGWWLVGWALAQVAFCCWWSRHQAKRKRLHDAFIRSLTPLDSKWLEGK